MDTFSDSEIRYCELKESLLSQSLDSLSEDQESYMSMEDRGGIVGDLLAQIVLLRKQVEYLQEQLEDRTTKFD